MVLLVIVIVACFVAGVWAATRWLPPLADGVIGTIVFFIVCGVAGAVVAVAGIHVWQLVYDLTRREYGLGAPDFVADSVSDLLGQVGLLATLGAIAYLVAPKPERPDPN